MCDDLTAHDDDAALAASGLRDYGDALLNP